MTLKMPSKNVLIIIAVLVVAGIAVKLLFFRSEFLYAGTLEGTKVDVSARLSSDIQSVPVDEGDHVKAGDVLDKLACEDYLVAQELANINYSRNQKLNKAGTVTKEVLDQLLNKKKEADIKVDWCTVKSPVNGVVLSRYHEPGEWVDPGTKLMTLTDVRDIWAYIYVPQPTVASLKPGQKLDGLLPELNKTFTGTILKINDEAEFTPKNVQTRAERTRLVFGVKVSFKGSNEEEILKPGMTIEISLPKS
jgi:HlyD family secretion protein